MVNKSRKKVKNISRKEMYEEVPNDIKVIYGKFYFYSLIYLIFFLVLFPFVLASRISMFSSGLIVGMLGVFFIYMIVDVIKKSKTYRSIYFYVLILLVVLSISFSIVKLFI